ncbi:hypothetical protein CRG98_007665 [Punica granatum]|uniref:Uncharacterized protein n=1 Tax=Punica granatum TaxID=22663 RepID=A0A2I0KTX2_PUNGR|nr:hypothetical protein CRG98_007665 [Punica granatum]
MPPSPVRRRSLSTPRPSSPSLPPLHCTSPWLASHRFDLLSNQRLTSSSSRAHELEVAVRPSPCASNSRPSSRRRSSRWPSPTQSGSVRSPFARPSSNPFGPAAARSAQQQPIRPTRPNPPVKARPNSSGRDF